MAKNAWHWMDIAQICTQLDTNAASGLTRKQASSRIKKLNIRQPEALHPLFLPAQRPFYRHVGKMLLNPVMLLTLLVALIALLFGEYASLGGVMVAILLLYTLGCAFASAKAHDVWRTLQLYSNPMVKVIRGGKLYTMDARNVVPGDVVCLSEGDVCPADIRIDTGYRASVSQYVLTDRDAAGYVRISAQKDGDVLYSAEDEIHSPDCVNIIYAGSVIEQGFVRGVVVETGKHTYLGASLGTVPGTELASEPDSTAFIRRYFSRFATVQAVLLVPLTILMTVTLRQSLSFTECFLTALALCCTAIAEYAVTLAGFVRATGMDAAASQKENAALEYALAAYSVGDGSLLEALGISPERTEDFSEKSERAEFFARYGDYSLLEELGVDLTSLSKDDLMELGEYFAKYGDYSILKSLGVNTDSRELEEYYDRLIKKYKTES